jgi:hypothetical protein
MYKMIWEASGAFVCMTNNKYLCELWHRRIGHLHNGALRIAREITRCIPEFSIEHDDVCRGCALGKYTKAPFPGRHSRTIGILDLIHSDVSGRMSSPSLRGHDYYVLFIDDHSMKTWIYFLKHKGEVFARFQEFKSLVENQTGKKIKVLRSDNGAEYALDEFIDFYTMEGIKREMAVPYNPE